jgi:hypothetical protein
MNPNIGIQFINRQFIQMKEENMFLILTLHSIVRWIIVIVALVSIIKFTMGWLQNKPFDKMANGLYSAFSGLMDTQFLLGLIFFIWSGLAGMGFPGYRWEHLIVMAIAVVISHLPSRWKKLPDALRYRNTLFAVSGALFLVIIGILVLPGARWLHISGLF